MENIERTIRDILEEFSNSIIIFSNEAQFQFDLAWALKEKLCEKYEVLLEVLALDDENPDKKNYIDIVLRDKKEKKFVPIELKYKTPDKRTGYKCINYTKDGVVIGKTYFQGAADVGSYDFWKDVERIERFESQALKLDKYNDYQFECGFALLLTNYGRYNDIQFRGNGLYEDFFPYHKAVKQNLSANSYCSGDYLCSKRSNCNMEEDPVRVLDFKGWRDSQNKDEYIEACKRDYKLNDRLIRPIELRREYTCIWNAYKLDNISCTITTENNEDVEEPNNNYQSFNYLLLPISERRISENED